MCGPRLSASQHARHDALGFVAELGKFLIRKQIFPSHLGQLEQRVGAAQPVECKRDLLVAVLYQLEDAQIALMARVLALGDERQFFQDAVAQALKRNRLQRTEPSPFCFRDSCRHGLFVMPVGGIDEWAPFMGSLPRKDRRGSYMKRMLTQSGVASLRIEAELRDAAEEVLHEGETFSSFVEASIRESIARRCV